MLTPNVKTMMTSYVIKTWLNISYLRHVPRSNYIDCSKDDSSLELALAVLPCLSQGRQFMLQPGATQQLINYWRLHLVHDWVISGISHNENEMHQTSKSNKIISQQKEQKSYRSPMVYSHIHHTQYFSHELTLKVCVYHTPMCCNVLKTGTDKILNK